MLKKFLIVLAVLAVLIAAFCGFVAMQPSEFRVQRQAKMKAPPEAVFAQVNDFHNWETWSPWAKLDPNAKNTYEGPEAGKGAVLSWAGNDKVGEGRMTMTDSQPPERIEIKLDFIKPFESTANTEFNFKPEGDQTVVTWTMTGKNDFMGKAMCLFMDMDKMIGGDFDKGLASIKEIVEAPKK